MKALRISNLLLLALLVAPLAAQETFTPYVAKVTGDSVRLRSGAGLAHPPVTVMEEGEELTVVGSEDDWAIVELPAKAPCWIWGELVELSADGKTYTVTGKNVNLRIEPHTRHFPVGQADKDQVLKPVFDEETGEPVTSEGFMKIVPPSNATGAIASDFIEKVKNVAPEKSHDREPAPEDSTGEDVPDAAEIKTPKPERLDRDPTAEELEDERKTFVELQKMLEDELKKPAADVDLTAIRNMYEQFAEFALDKDVREKAELYIEKIDLTVKLIETENSRIAKEDAERKAEIERIREEALKEEEEPVEQPKGPVEYIAIGKIGSHGKSARTPASHRLFNDKGEVLYDVRWDDGDLKKLMGSKVGVTGKVKKYDGWPHKVIVIERIDVIDDGESK